MSNGKQSKPEDQKPGRIIDAEIEPVSPEDAAKPGRPDDPPRVDLRDSSGQADRKTADPGPAAAKTAAGAGTAADKPGESKSGESKPGDQKSGQAKAAGPAQPGQPGGAKAAGTAAAAGSGAKAGSSGGGSPGGSSGGSSGGSPPGGSPPGGSPWGGGPGKPAPRSRGLLWTLVAAVVVLLVLLIGLVASPIVAPWLPGALGVAGQQADGGALQDDVAQLQSRLGALEGQVTSAGSASAAVQDQAGQLTDLRRTVDGLQKQIQSMGGLAGRMDQLQKQVAALPKEDAGKLEQAVTALQQQQDLQAKLQQAGGIDPEVEKRLKAVEADITSVTRLADSIQRRMSGMDNRFNDLRGQDDALDRRLSGLDDRIAAAARPAPQVTDALAKLQSQDSASAQALQDLRQELARLQAALKEEAAARLAAEDRSSGRNQRVALVLGLGRIEDRMESGAAFAAEAASLPQLLTGSLARDPRAQEAVALLRREGGSGVASFEALREAFMAAADKAVLQRSAAGSDSDLWGQIVDGARGLVSIRPVGDAAGDTPGAILARAESALAERDLARAVAEVGKLSGSAAEAMSGWLAQARARLAVTGALADLNDAITASLGPAATGAGTQGPSGTQSSSQPGTQSGGTAAPVTDSSAPDAAPSDPGGGAPAGQAAPEAAPEVTPEAAPSHGSAQ